MTAVTLAACSSSSSSPATGKDGGNSNDAAVDDGGSGDDGPVTTLPDGAPIPREHLRIMAGNLSTGNNQNYDGGEGERIFTGLHADVILIQEFNVGDNSDGVAQTFVETVCGPGCSYFREPTSYHIPNGVISRFPIVSSGDWDDPSTTDREFAWAQIDIPGPIDLYAVSVHLLTSGSTQRSTQATDLVALVNANVPAGSYVVIGGDLNTESRDEAATSTTGLGSIVDTEAPYPADGANDENTNQPR
ncbi:MAG: endonuclease/exonuclease/phosphatase family protein, partial [Polyangiaceae bacterium]